MFAFLVCLICKTKRVCKKEDGCLRCSECDYVLKSGEGVDCPESAD